MRILFIANTVFELYYLSAVAYLLREAQPDIRLSLLVRPRTTLALNPQLASLYADVQELEIVYLSGRADWDILNTVRFRYRLDQLDLRADIVCISSFREYFANVLTRRLASQTRLVALRMCDHGVDDHYDGRRPLLEAYYNLFNRIFGMSSMEYRWDPDEQGFSTKWYRRDFYHRTICISDWGHQREGKTFRLPAPFASLKGLYQGSHDDQQKDTPAILVAGERTPVFPVWSEKSQAQYRALFDFLRKQFTGYRLLFKPRPKFTDSSSLPLDGFKLMSPDTPFEELCLRHNFHRVISVKSTASKVAAYCGLPSYLLYPMFDLPKSMVSRLESYFADMRSIMRVGRFSDLLREPICPQQSDDLPTRYWEAVAG